MDLQYLILKIILFILILIILFLIFVVIKMYKKINIYESFIIAFKERVDYASRQLKLIDNKGSFETDDEIGFFFSYIKELNLILSSLFKEKNEDNK